MSRSPVIIEPGLVERLGEALAPFARDGRIVMLVDEDAWAAHGQWVRDSLERAGLHAEIISIAGGETSKCWDRLSGLIDRLLALGMERGDHLVIFGGGVAGDLGGFAAAILKRGIPWVQIPTTLVAQADSAIGGKTAINAAAGKNMVGAFHMPSAVLIDPGLLSTLDPRELCAGYAEVVKAGLVADSDFFSWCETHAAAMLRGDASLLTEAITHCVRFKSAIVAADEEDRDGRRALLNFGHTFGHALETLGEGSLRHGEAVAIGMAMAMRFSATRGDCRRADAERVEAHLRSVGLPVRAGDAAPDRVLAQMASDKKVVGGAITLILSRGIGAAFIERNCARDALAAFLAGDLKD